MRIITFILMMFVVSQSFTQKVTPYKLETTYWDKKKKVVRSTGYINNNQFMSYYGVKEGLWKFYHENGNLQEISYFNRGVYVNKSEQYYSSGKIMIKSFFYLGVKDSSYTYFFENGRIAETGMFNKGDKSGTWEEWYIDSTMRKVTVYDSLGMERVGSFWDKDRKKTIVNGSGSIKSYFSNGKLKESFSYKDSLLHG